MIYKTYAKDCYIIGQTKAIVFTILVADETDFLSFEDDQDIRDKLNSGELSAIGITVIARLGYLTGEDYLGDVLVSHTTRERDLLDAVEDNSMEDNALRDLEIKCLNMRQILVG